MYEYKRKRNFLKNFIFRIIYSHKGKKVGKGKRYCDEKSIKNVDGKLKKVLWFWFFRFSISCVFLAYSFAVFSMPVSVFDKNKDVYSTKDYDNIIWPVVMQNPEPFGENHPPNSETVIRASLWELAMNQESEKFQSSEYETLVLSEKEVKETAQKLFGKEVILNDFKNSENSFYKFDEKNKVFLVEPISGTSGFLPHTINASHKNNEVILNVGYVAPCNQFDSSLNKVWKNKIEKTVKYKLKKNFDTGEFYVSAVI